MAAALVYRWAVSADSAMVSEAGGREVTDEQGSNNSFIVHECDICELYQMVLVG